MAYTRLCDTFVSIGEAVLTHQHPRPVSEATLGSKSARRRSRSYRCTACLGTNDAPAREGDSPDPLTAGDGAAQGEMRDAYRVSGPPQTAIWTALWTPYQISCFLPENSTVFKIFSLLFAVGQLFKKCCSTRGS